MLLHTCPTVDQGASSMFLPNRDVQSSESEVLSDKPVISDSRSETQYNRDAGILPDTVDCQIPLRRSQRLIEKSEQLTDNLEGPDPGPGPRRSQRIIEREQLKSNHIVICNCNHNNCNTYLNR